MFSRIKRFFNRKFAAISISSSSISYSKQDVVTDLVATFVLAVLLFSLTKMIVPVAIFLSISAAIVFGIRFSRDLIDVSRYVLAA